MHLLDATLFYAPHSGGVKRYLGEKRRRCAARGVRHTLLVPGPRDDARDGVVRLASPAIPFGAGYRLPLRLGAWQRAIEAAAPDAIEVGDPYSPAWAALRAAARLGVPAVAFAHSDLPRLLASRGGAWAGRAADAYLRRLYARFDAVWAPSRAIARRLEQAGVTGVAVQPLGVDPEIFHPCRRDPALRAELGLPESTRLLIFAGRLAAEKRIPLLRVAVQRLGAPYHLLLVGGDALRRLDARTTLLPYQQDSAALARLLASADVLVHAGEHETFGIVILEAMACARPVVGVAAGAIPELVDARVGALARPGDAAAIAAAIDDVYARDPDALGAAARARVERDYAWARTLDRQLDAYARLLQRPAAIAAAALTEAG